LGRKEGEKKGEIKEEENRWQRINKPYYNLFPDSDLWETKGFL